MINTILAATADGLATINPEAMIKAAIAASNAEAAAWNAAIMAAVTLVVLLVVGALMGMIWLKFSALEHNTDGMREALIIATRKLALIEGNVIGRAEQSEEQAGLKLNEEKDKGET